MLDKPSTESRTKSKELWHHHRLIRLNSPKTSPISNPRRHRNKAFQRLSSSLRRIQTDPSVICALLLIATTVPPTNCNALSSIVRMLGTASKNTDPRDTPICYRRTAIWHDKSNESRIRLCSCADACPNGVDRDRCGCLPRQHSHRTFYIVRCYKSRASPNHSRERINCGDSSPKG